MSDWTEPRAWIERAEEDYVLARWAMRRKTPLTYGAAFHAQQCAEKYLKALLIAHRQASPRTHDLAALGDLCLRNGIVLPVEQDALDRLTSYSVQVRYPGETPELPEVEEALRIAQTIRRFARKMLKQALD
jgi:HEPN domain-containing protein